MNYNVYQSAYPPVPNVIYEHIPRDDWDFLVYTLAGALALASIAFILCMLFPNLPLVWIRLGDKIAALWSKWV